MRLGLKNTYTNQLYKALEEFNPLRDPGRLSSLEFLTLWFTSLSTFIKLQVYSKNNSGFTNTCLLP